MKKQFLVYALIAILGFGAYSCQNDSKIQKELATALSIVQSDLTVEFKDGVATLNGTVEDPDVKTSAENVAKVVKGVKSVVNNIQVKEPVVVINPDETLQSTITAALALGGFKDVQVAIKEGEVTLSGDIKRNDLQKVMQIANEAKPKKVINQLNIK